MGLVLEPGGLAANGSETLLNMSNEIPCKPSERGIDQAGFMLNVHEFNHWRDDLGIGHVLENSGLPI